MRSTNFGASESPFSISPDPAFLFETDRIRDQYAELRNTIFTESGFYLITGDAGVGKTLLQKRILAAFPEGYLTLTINDPSISVSQLRVRILTALGENADPDINQHGTQLETCLENLICDDGHLIIVIEESQNLSVEMLEFLRCLGNLESPKRKSISVLFVGQTELIGRLNRVDLRQLQQRILCHVHLQPLNGAEIFKYIAHRLETSGLSTAIFESAALRVISKSTGGNPRRINHYCSRALALAERRGAHRVTKDIMLQVCESPSIGTGSGFFRRYPFFIFALALAVPFVLTPQPLYERLVEGVAFLTEGVRSSAQYISADLDSEVSHRLESGNTELVPSQQKQVPVEKQNSDNTLEEAALANPKMVMPDAPSDITSPVISLFKLWGIEISDEINACDAANDHGLSCYQLDDADLSILRRLNRPALIGHRADGKDSVALLVELLPEDRFRLLTEQSMTVEMTEAELNDSWDHSVTLLWVPPEGYLWPLRVGASNYEVTFWLQDALNKLGYVDGRIVTGGVFTEQFSALVQLVQQNSGLNPDGVLGPQTIMAINESLGGVPTLNNLHK